VPRAAYREARTWFEQALRALEHLRQTHDKLELAIDLRFDLRSTLTPLGEVEAALHCLRDCASLAEALGDRQRLGGVFSRMGDSFVQIGDYTRAIEVGERALTIAEAFADVAMEWSAAENLGRVYHAVGDYRRAVECLERGASASRHLRAVRASAGGTWTSLARTSVVARSP
jgi:tetratricopeptide (TPR) repeat protein